MQASTASKGGSTLRRNEAGDTDAFMGEFPEVRNLKTTGTKPLTEKTKHD